MPRWMPTSLPPMTAGLLVLMLFTLSGCASSPPASQMVLPGCPPPPQVPALPAPIAAHSSQPAAGYSLKERAWLQKVEGWQQKAATWLDGLTKK